jgi:DNA-binding IscR family transcriptional regulator
MRYALLLLMLLAPQNKGEPVTLHEILAEKE